MAKIVGFGQTGFVARMQKASLFGYEPFGAMERAYSPYAFASLGEDAGPPPPPSPIQCPDGANPDFNAETQTWECPPKVFDCPGGKSPVLTGGVWGCPGTIRFGEREQMQLSIVNRSTGQLDPSNYGLDKTRDVDGVWGSRSDRAIKSYAKLRGFTEPFSWQVLDALAAETASAPAMRDAAEYKKLKDRIWYGQGGPAPAVCPPGQTGKPPNCAPIGPKSCPEGTTGTPPNCKPKTNLASVVVGATLLATAVGLLAVAARNRQE